VLVKDVVDEEGVLATELVEVVVLDGFLVVRVAELLDVLVDLLEVLLELLVEAFFVELVATLLEVDCLVAMVVCLWLDLLEFGEDDLSLRKVNTMAEIKPANIII
jgi:hypothetical protein